MKYNGKHFAIKAAKAALHAKTTGGIPNPAVTVPKLYLLECNTQQ